MLGWIVILFPKIKIKMLDVSMLGEMVSHILSCAIFHRPRQGEYMKSSKYKTEVKNSNVVVTSNNPTVKYSPNQGPRTRTDA